LEGAPPSQRDERRRAGGTSAAAPVSPPSPSPRSLIPYSRVPPEERAPPLPGSSSRGPASASRGIGIEGHRHRHRGASTSPRAAPPWFLPGLWHLLSHGVTTRDRVRGGTQEGALGRGLARAGRGASPWCLAVVVGNWRRRRAALPGSGLPHAMYRVVFPGG
jgi:hypothetical protein